MYDIAVNKFETISMSPRTKDYIDLHLILKENDWTIDKLRVDAQIKFGIHTDTLQLAKQFLRAKEFQDFPRILAPFNKKEMEDFFLTEAKKLEKDIFKK